MSDKKRAQSRDVSTAGSSSKDFVVDAELMRRLSKTTDPREIVDLLELTTDDIERGIQHGDFNNEELAYLEELQLALTKAPEHAAARSSAANPLWSSLVGSSSSMSGLGVSFETGFTQVLSALTEKDAGVSIVVTSMAMEGAEDIVQAGSALVYGARTAGPADFARVAPVVAHRGKIDRPGLGTDGTQLLVQLAGDETLLQKLAAASKEAIHQSIKDFLESRSGKSGVLNLALSDRETFQFGLSTTNVLQVRLCDDETLQVLLSDSDTVCVRLSDTEILQIQVIETHDPKGRERKVVQLKLGDRDVLQVRLNDTEILQLSLSDSEILEMWLSDTEILQLKLSDTEILQVRRSDTDILQSQLRDTEILQARLNEIGVSSTEDERGEIPLQLSDTEILRLRRRERFVSAALAVLEESGFSPMAHDVADFELKIAQVFAMFVGPDRDEDLLELLLAVAGFLPALKLVGATAEAKAMERLAERQNETLLALSRLASEKSKLLKALVDLFTGGLGLMSRAEPYDEGDQPTN